MCVYLFTFLNRLTDLFVYFSLYVLSLLSFLFCIAVYTSNSEVPQPVSVLSQLYICKTPVS